MATAEEEKKKEKFSLNGPALGVGDAGTFAMKGLNAAGEKLGAAEAAAVNGLAKAGSAITAPWREWAPNYEAYGAPPPEQTGKAQRPSPTVDISQGPAGNTLAKLPETLGAFPAQQQQPQQTQPLQAAAPSSQQQPRKFGLGMNPLPGTGMARIESTGETVSIAPDGPWAYRNSNGNKISQLSAQAGMAPRRQQVSPATQQEGDSANTLAARGAFGTMRGASIAQDTNGVPTISLNAVHQEQLRPAQDPLDRVKATLAVEAQRRMANGMFGPDAIRAQHQLLALEQGDLARHNTLANTELQGKNQLAATDMQGRYGLARTDAQAEGRMQNMQDSFDRKLAAQREANEARSRLKSQLSPADTISARKALAEASLGGITDNNIDSINGLREMLGMPQMVKKGKGKDAKYVAAGAGLQSPQEKQGAVTKWYEETGVLK